MGPLTTQNNKKNFTLFAAIFMMDSGSFSEVVDIDFRSLLLHNHFISDEDYKMNTAQNLTYLVLKKPHDNQFL